MIYAGYLEANLLDFELVSSYNISENRSLSDDDLFETEGATIRLLLNQF